MKRLKFPLSIATSVAFLLFILSGCSKNEPEILSVDKSEKVSIKEIKQVDDKFANFESFLKSESFQILKTNIGDFKIESIQAVSFYDESISGFIIIINDAKGYKRDLMTVYEAAEPNKFTTLLRENNVDELNGKINGKVIWYDATYSKLNEMHVVANKISNFKVYTSDKSLSHKNARFASIKGGCKWHCNNDEFNREYQRAKDECESNWQCDFACSFNVCAISYLAVAIRRCVTCEL